MKIKVPLSGTLDTSFGKMSLKDDGRHFSNTFPLYKQQNNGEFVDQGGKLRPDLAETINEGIKKLSTKLYEGISHTPFDDHSVYTGCSGITLLNLHLNRKSSPQKEYLETATKYLGKPREKRCTFLCGDAGILALQAVIHHDMGMPTEAKDTIYRLEKMYENVCKDHRLPDEILYGRAGYLYSLLFVRHFVGRDSISAKAIREVALAMIESGRHLSQKEHSPSPLMYTWHDQHYLGAAHGLAGIFTILLQINDSEIDETIHKYVRPSVDYMLTLMFPSGNSPPSLDSRDKDKLIHWCHGAPGWVHMFAVAYQTYEDPKYLSAAERCAAVIWERGLLHKGYGLCHGTAGNAYAFLALYQLTKDQKYVYMAYKFAEWCIAYGSHGCRTPDSPFSMYEGMAGTIYFLADLLDPLNAAFPAQVLPPSH